MTLETKIVILILFFRNNTMDEKSFSTEKTAREEDVIRFYDRYATSWDDRFGCRESTSYFLQSRFVSLERTPLT